METNKNTGSFNPAALPVEFMKTLGATVNNDGSAKKFLLPGQMFSSREATTVTTILGSCVAVCLWSPRTGIGGINHYLLSTGPAGEAKSLRYGCNANPALLNDLIAMGCDPRTLQAKIFGGATTMNVADPAQSLGKKNIDLAVEFVKSHRIPIMEKHISQQRGCKLTFRTNDGFTQLKAFED